MREMPGGHPSREGGVSGVAWARTSAVMAKLDRVVARFCRRRQWRGGMRRSPWGDTEEVRSLFRAAGFGESHIRDHIGEVRFPTARSMLDGLTGAHAPLAGAIAALGEDEREALYREIEQTLATYTDTTE